MKPRLLILTAGFGEGHNAAARAVAAAADALHGPGTARVADVFALAAPRLNALVRRSYLDLINRSPGLWRLAYAWLDESRWSARLFRLLRPELRRLEQLLASERPTAICSTYPAYAFLLEVLAERGCVIPPAFNVVTDSISINSLWWRAACDGWFVPNEDSASVMRAAGVDAGRLQVFGFPVAPFFSAEAGRLAPPPLAAGTRPRVLYIINSGRPVAAEMARTLLRQSDWEITCTVGHNQRLRRELETLAVHRPHPTRILGWTDEIPRLLLTHHVLVSKAGGATTQEAVAARCPMIVNQIVPGQEEGNYELLRRHEIGALAETPEALMTELHRAFFNRGEIWAAWRAAVGRLSRPDAARDIVTAIVAHPLPLGDATRPAAQPTRPPANLALPAST